MGENHLSDVLAELLRIAVSGTEKESGETFGKNFSADSKIKKAVAEEGIGGLAGRTKGYLARAKKEKEFQREKSRVYRDILFISGCNEQLPHPHRYRVVHQMEQLEAGGYTCDTVYFQELKLDGTLLRRVRDFPLPDDGHLRELPQWQSR